MKIFETYTGNAMLNNALMTIEALGKLESVSEITTEILLKLYHDKGLLKLNKRLKSYTMLFTKNGPLHNDKNNGEKIYETLFKEIINTFENEGNRLCEISGLRYNVPFESVFESALKVVGLSDQEIKKKDTSLNRTWFPLIGGLGSDAQALPQAKYTIQIHPICVAILQFLPLSSLLYKGGILLIDSSNFDFSKGFIRENQEELEKRIQATKSTDAVENVRDFSKGNYLLKAIRILENKQDSEESYSDLNLWSFSNSGTGASCEIDRVPNGLIQKLNHLKKNPEIRSELFDILNSNESSYSFLNDLEDNVEWRLLYPNAFGSGKKKVVYKGVSVNFMDAYLHEIGSSALIGYAKYLAYLIDKYKSKSFDKYLLDTSAWNEKEYRIDLYAVLVEATKKGEWDMYHQLQIIDNNEQVPLRNTFYKIRKLTHFYYQKKKFINQLPVCSNTSTEANAACEWLLSIIQQDENKARTIKDLTSPQEYISVGYTGMLLRSAHLSFVSMESIVYTLYNDDFILSKNGANELLRIFFSQTDQPIIAPLDLKMADKGVLNEETKEWLEAFEKFAKDYQAYYFDKYENKNSGRQPQGKFRELINDISLENTGFLYWFMDAVEKTNEFLKMKKDKVADTWSDTLLYNPQGEFAISFTKFAIKFSLLKQYHHSFNQQQTITIS